MAGEKRNPCICDYNQYGTHTQGCYDHQYRPQREASARAIAEKHRSELAVVLAARAWAKARATEDVVREEVAAVELWNAVLETDERWYR